MALIHHRFIVLFAVLLTFFVLAPVLQELRQTGHGWPPVLEGVLFVALLTGTVLSIVHRRAEAWIAISLALPAALFWIVNLWTLSHGMALARQVCGAAFLIYAIIVVLRFVFHSRHVTYDTVCASLCVYLLLGLVWAMIYAILETATPGAFSFTKPVERGDHSAIIAGDTIFLYLSFTTLTTLGYGDAVPTTPISRMLACFEALMGQLYLVVLVSRLVGLEIAESLERRRAKPRPHDNEEPAKQ
jgi:Zn-dependent protease with chaperone function